MGFKPALDRDGKDICPFLSAAAADPKKEKNDLVRCRFDCALHFIEEDCCALALLAVRLNTLNEHLAEIRKSGIDLNGGNG